MKFTEKPNLPESDVIGVIANCDMSAEAIYTLNMYGIDIIDTPITKNTDKYISKHADISIVHLGGENFLCEPDSFDYYSKNINNSNICTGRGLCKKYPGDVAYNVAIIGNVVICKTSSADDKILLYAENNGYKVINTAQGYSKCNICIIDEKAIITSDINIYGAVRNFGIDVLLVDDSAVLLNGYNQGFLGGASGKISKDKLAVNGDIKLHKNADEIIKFAKKYDVEIISLCKGYISDIGSILPIFEK